MLTDNDDRVCETTTRESSIEQKLREAEESLETIERIAHIGDWEYRPAHKNSTWSKEIYRIFGIENRDAISLEQIVQRIHPDDRERFLESNARLVAGDPYDVEFRVIRPDGEERIVQSKRTRFTDRDGQIRLMGTVQDITEQKRMLELMLENEKLALVGQLAAGIAHNLRNPLSSVSGFLQLLREKYPEGGHYLDIMKHELDQINLITGQLLSVSKPHALERELWNINELLDSIVDLVSPTAFTQRVDIESDCTGIHFVYCNESEIRQAFLNVIKNGIEAMPDGGRLLIQMQCQPGSVEIRFVDQGVGIAPDVLRNLFSPFYTTKDAGTGLGLMMTKRIIEGYGGKIGVESAPTSGTTVTITLPTEQRKDSNRNESW